MGIGRKSASGEHLAAQTSPPSHRRIAYAAVAAVLLGWIALQAVDGQAWAPILVGFLAPDLGLLAGTARGLEPGRLHPRAVPLYNALHRFWGPAALVALAAGGVLGAGWFVVGLTWAAHIAVDRAAGYGLRTRLGFQRGA